MFTHLSNDPLAKYSALGLNATEYTGSLRTQRGKEEKVLQKEQEVVRKTRERKKKKIIKKKIKEEEN